MVLASAFRGAGTSCAICSRRSSWSLWGCVLLGIPTFCGSGIQRCFTNPHGSTTYGQAFINAVVNHYGEQDYRDVLAGLDRAIERYSDKIDATRQIIIGGSYGGFMTTWAIGHTDRFQAAVSQRPVTEWLHLTGASDIGYNFVADEMGATPYTEAGRAELIKRSPITYAGAVKTPLLMMHGEYDLRTPIAQTEMYFTAVKTLTDTPVEMVRFRSHGTVCLVTDYRTYVMRD